MFVVNIFSLNVFLHFLILNYIEISVLKLHYMPEETLDTDLCGSPRNLISQ